MVAATTVVLAVTDHLTPLAGIVVGVITQTGAEAKATAKVWLAEVADDIAIVPATSLLPEF